MLICGKEITLFPGRAADAPLVVLHTDGEEAAKIVKLIQQETEADFALAAVAGVDWDRDMSPWPIDPVFKGGPAYAGGADAYLARLTGELLPALEGKGGLSPRARYLAGYSLAGLFALYALTRTGVFTRAASVSGSLWYPGWPAYLREHFPRPLPERVYLSLGDREARTRNPSLQPVEDNTRAAEALFRQAGVPVRFELNPGNHFQQPEERTARGIAWLVGEER